MSPNTHADRLRAALQVLVEVARTVDDKHAQRIARRAIEAARHGHAFQTREPDIRALCNELGKTIQIIRQGNDGSGKADRAVTVFSGRYTALFEAMRRMAPRQLEAARVRYRGR